MVCNAAIINYYKTHKYVANCAINEGAQIDRGYMQIEIQVQFKEAVVDFLSFGVTDDKVGFLEALTEHINDGKYEESSSKEMRKLIQMVNLTAPRLLILDTLKGSSKPRSEEILLTEFIFPGPLNHMASLMTKIPSSLQSIDDLFVSNILSQNKSGRFEDLESIKLSNRIDDSMVFQAKCVSVALEHLGLLSPEQLKFGKQDSVALVWSLGVLLYRVAFKDKHPFMLSEESIGNSTRNFQQRLDVKTAGLIA